jgi:hypothetical protein
VNLAPRKVAGEISEGLLFDIGYADEITPVLAQQRSRFRTAPARAEGPVEGLLSVAKLPMKSYGEAPGEPGAAACSAKSGPTMLT